MGKDSDQSANSVTTTLHQFHLLNCLGTLAALQGCSENRERIFDLQELVFDVLENNRTNAEKLDYSNIRLLFPRLFSTQKSIVHSQNPFSTNITSFLGNTTIFAGVFSGGSFLVQSLLNIIFLDQLNTFPPEFHKDIYAAAYFILNVGNAYCEEIGIKPFQVYNQPSDNLFIPEEILFQRHYKAGFTHKESTREFLSKRKMDKNIIDHFILEPKSAINNYYNAIDPLLTRPFYSTHETLILLAPGSLLSALNFFIWEKAVKHKCITKLNIQFEIEANQQVQNAVIRFHWKRIKITDQTYKPIQHSIYEIDTDKVGVVLLIPEDVTAENYNSANPIIPVSEPDNNNWLEERTNLVETFLDQPDYKSRKRLYIYVGANAGRKRNVSIKQKQGLAMVIPVHEWIWLCHADDDHKEFNALTLWYFVKSLDGLYHKYQVSSLTILEIFTLYLAHNESFYLSNESPSLIEFDPGISENFITSAEKYSAGKVLAYLDEGHPAPVFVPVRIADKFDELFIPEYSTGLTYEFAISGFPGDIWFKPADRAGLLELEDHEKDFYIEVIKMIAYWLNQVKPYLAPYLERLFLPVLDVRVGIADPGRFYNKEEIEGNDDVRAMPPVDANMTNAAYRITLTSYFADMLNEVDNRGEILLLQHLLNAFHRWFVSVELYKQLPDLQVDAIVKEIAPLGRKKKLTIFNNLKDPRMSDKGLGRTQYLQGYQTNKVLDELLQGLDETYLENLNEISAKKDKLDFLHKLIFEILIPKLRNCLELVSSELLLVKLIGSYERIIYKKKTQEVNIPTVKFCYPDIFEQDFMPKVRETNVRISESSLAYRCLIEFISAEQHTGSGPVSQELTDEILAIMSTIIDLGFINDQLYHDLSVDNLAILKSRRIGFQRSFLTKVVQPHQLKNLELTIDSFHEDFDDFFEQKKSARSAEANESLKKVNDSYQSVYNFNFEELIEFLISLSEIGFDQSGAFAVFSRQSLIEKLAEKDARFTTEKISHLISFLSMEDRGNALEVPPGFDPYEASPWRFNRQLSYISKPLVVVKDKAYPDDPKIYFGIRHLVDSAEQLENKIPQGRLRDKKLKTLNSFFLDKKGTKFNDFVFDWFAAFANLKNFKTVMLPGTLGDIDIVTVDPLRRVVYLFEAKNVFPSKVAKEMAEERDRFLIGDKKGPGWFEKHYKRYLAIKADKSILQDRININLDNYHIVPCFIVSYESFIPLLPDSPVFKQEYRFPMISFRELKEKGISLLETLTYDY